MTTQELIELKDVLHWASMQAKTDGMYQRVQKCKAWVERDYKLKVMNPVTEARRIDD